MSDLEINAFRETLARFPTGVTVITSRSPEGLPVGLTATSFNSVSLDPPLVLWSLQRDSSLLDAFTQGNHFAVHILSEDQVPVSQRFATRDIDRFDGTSWREGIEGLPVINGCVAVFQCRKYAQYDGGDHDIFVGEVVEFESNKGESLAFYRSGYAGLNRDLHSTLE